MSITSTGQAKLRVEAEVYQKMSPALELPNRSAAGGKIEFTERADIFINEDEQKLLNPFLQDVCVSVRSRCGGFAPAERVHAEAARRMKISMQHAAGLKDTPNGKRLSAPEVQTIKNPYIRMMVQNIVGSDPVWADDSSDSSTPSFASGVDSGTASPGPYNYDDMPVDGPLMGTSGRSGAGPHYFDDGIPSDVGSQWGERSGGSQYDEFGGGGNYIGAMPIF